MWLVWASFAGIYIISAIEYYSLNKVLKDIEARLDGLDKINTMRR